MVATQVRPFLMRWGGQAGGGFFCPVCSAAVVAGDVDVVCLPKLNSANWGNSFSCRTPGLAWISRTISSTLGASKKHLGGSGCGSSVNVLPFILNRQATLSSFQP